MTPIPADRLREEIEQLEAEMKVIRASGRRFTDRSERRLSEITLSLGKLKAEAERLSES